MSFQEVELKTLEGKNGQTQTVSFRNYPALGLLQFEVHAITEFGRSILRGHFSPNEVLKLKNLLGARQIKRTVLVHVKNGKFQVYGNDAMVNVNIIDEDQNVIAKEDLNKILEENPIRL